MYFPCISLQKRKITLTDFVLTFTQSVLTQLAFTESFTQLAFTQKVYSRNQASFFCLGRHVFYFLLTFFGSSLTIGICDRHKILTNPIPFYYMQSFFLVQLHAVDTRRIRPENYDYHAEHYVDDSYPRYA